MKIRINKIIFGLAITNFILSCSHSSHSYFVKVGEQNSKLNMQILLMNKQDNDTLYFNLNKLNLSCNRPQNIQYKLITKRDVKRYNGNNFVIENQNKEFRFFNDSIALNSLESNAKLKDDYISFSYIAHCDSMQIYLLESNNPYYIDYIEIDERLLKVKESDTKIRLWYFDENQNKPIISNWIGL